MAVISRIIEQASVRINGRIVVKDIEVTDCWVYEHHTLIVHGRIIGHDIAVHFDCKALSWSAFAANEAPPGEWNAQPTPDATGEQA